MGLSLSYVTFDKVVFPSMTTPLGESKLKEGLALFSVAFTINMTCRLLVVASTSNSCCVVSPVNNVGSALASVA